MIPIPEFNFRRTPVTLIVTAVAFALEIVCTIDPDRREYYYNDLKLGISPMIWVSTLWPPHYWLGELWRPFTTTLLHGTLLHMLFNIYWMATFGGVLENWLGSYRMLALLIWLAYMSSLAEYVFSDSGLVGLSGVVYGLLGVLWMGRRQRVDFAIVCNDQTLKLMMAWFFFCIVISNMGIMPIGNVAHGAGLVFGVLFGLSCFSRYRVQWTVATVAASLIVGTTLFYCPGHRGYERAQTYAAILRANDEAGLRQNGR